MFIDGGPPMRMAFMRCEFSKKDEDRLAKLREGDTVTVLGYCIAVPSMFQGCRLVE